jgi:hypothetical protein
MTDDTLAEIATAVGGKVIGRSVRVVWPGKDTRKIGGVAISLASNRYGFIVNSFYHDVAASDAFDFVRSSLRRSGVEVSALDQFIDGDQHEARAERMARAMEHWDEGVDPRGTLAERYLNERRKLTVPAEAAGNVLRWNARIHTLIGLFRDVRTDEPTGITRIYLKPDGSMFHRGFLGVVGGSAVKLNPPQEGLLCIAEGVETAMAAQQLRIGPTWALGSASAIANSNPFRTCRR